jgi:predicted AlkP superfamily pyrophosphatase or phosphodiesterase
MKKAITILLFSFLSSLGFASQQPKLILQIVVDQLRGDLIFKHQHQFTNTGFNYLISHSLDYHNAHHAHANTTTCAGHTSIATGSIPSLHGIIDNEWFDRKSGQIIYCVADQNVKILPTQHTRTQIDGRSPRLIKASTLSDEIVLAQKGKAFAVSLKDRAAISLAGHAGMAYWFDKTNGGFVTSSYYLDKYPVWVEDWNKKYNPQSYDWTLLNPKSSYINADVKPFRHNYGSFGQTFPHHIVTPPSEEYFKALSRSPKADQLTEDFAELLLKEEKLGLSNNKTDYLAISFSAVDAIGHQFGPNSLEAEDNLLSLDRTIGKLLKAVDKQVGLDNTVIVLSADHGVSDGPAYLKAHRIPEIKPINIDLIEQRIKSILLQQYNLPPQTLMSVTPPFVYLDHQLIVEKQLDVRKVSQFIAENLSNQPGIYRAFPLPITNIEKDWLSIKVDRMAYTYRAGDVYLVQPPYQSYGAKNEDRVSHGSPWQYDSYVPLLFVNPKFQHKKFTQQVFTTDIAPTIAMLLQIKPPSATVGSPLVEVINQFFDKG